MKQVAFQLLMLLASRSMNAHGPLGSLPQWNNLPALCAALQTDRWRPRNPLDHSDGTVAEARVGNGRIYLCLLVKTMEPVKGMRAAEVQLFLQKGGGDAVEIVVRSWTTHRQRRAEIIAALRDADNVLQRLGVEAPESIRRDILEEQDTKEIANGLQFEVSTTSRHSALVIEPELDPKLVPELEIDLSIREPNGDDE